MYFYNLIIPTSVNVAEAHTHIIAITRQRVVLNTRFLYT